MDSGPSFAILRAAMVVMEDTVVQLGQASLELQAARSKWLFSLQELIVSCEYLTGLK